MKTLDELDRYDWSHKRGAWTTFRATLAGQCDAECWNQKRSAKGKEGTP